MKQESTPKYLSPFDRNLSEISENQANIAMISPTQKDEVITLHDKQKSSIDSAQGLIRTPNLANDDDEQMTGRPILKAHTQFGHLNEDNQSERLNHRLTSMINHHEARYSQKTAATGKVNPSTSPPTIRNLQAEDFKVQKVQRYLNKKSSEIKEMRHKKQVAKLNNSN